MRLVLSGSRRARPLPGGTVYEAQPVPSAPGAEWRTVPDGRIMRLRIVFDWSPFAEARTHAG